MRSMWKFWAAAAVSAGLLELPFPLAGPLPPWRSVFAWFGLVPLLWAVLSLPCRGASRGRSFDWSGAADSLRMTVARMERPKSSLRLAFFVAYLCGFLWYMGNCYWVRDTMLHYGDMPPLAPTLLLVGFSLVLGLYFGLFGLGIALVQRATGSTRIALALAPFFWTGLDLAAARITSVPWDQLGYSQVDNALVNQVAPWTGVYGITFILVATNALLAGGLLPGRDGEKKLASRWARGPIWTVCGAILLIVGECGVFVPAPRPDPTATAVLIQPNLDVGSANNWQGAVWNRHIDQFERLAQEQCKSYIAGIPQTGAATGEVVCPPYPTYPDLVVWPESPAPFDQMDPQFQKALVSVAGVVHAPLIVGGIGWTYDAPARQWQYYNSAIVADAGGQIIGRYDKIHLVPFGEYIPFQNLLSFAHKLTGRVSRFSRGTAHKVLLLDTQNGGGHRYGVFICYEDVFADEVRYFTRDGAEALVNISDDGWYGDTSAPWQHLNEARMRAIENRRWLLRDTNNGVTAAIDPYGRVRQSIPRHQTDALPAEFGFRDDVTFYTEHGDVFAWICAALSLGAVAWSLGQKDRTANSRRQVWIRGQD